MKVLVAEFNQPDKQFELTVAADETIDSLQAMIQQQTKIEPRAQRLMYYTEDGIYVIDPNNGRNLGMFAGGIPDGATIRLEDRSFMFK